MVKLESIKGFQIGAAVFRDPITNEYENTSYKLYMEADEQTAAQCGVEIPEDIRRLLVRKYQQYLNTLKSKLPGEMT